MDSPASEYNAYVGVWTNWSHGRVFGSTLTLTRSDGSLLVAFIALFITIIGTQLWRILCFSLHGVFSTGTPQDALHSQRQALLRNSMTPLGSIWLLLQMMHAWSRPATSNANTRPIKRLLPLALTTLLVAAALAVATGLSSRIARGNEVLLEGSHCGRVSFAGNATAGTLLGGPYQSRFISKAAGYAQRCYESASSDESSSTAASDECSSFPRSTLPLTVTANASCPFDDASMCLSQDANIILDSGLLDSHTDLGLNWPSGDRFQLQRRLHCAPLVTDGYRTGYTHENRTFVRYQYGDLISTQSECNCTLAISTATLNDLRLGLTSPFLEPGADFRFITMSAGFLNGSLLPDSENRPIPELSGHGGDLSLIFLMGNSMMFVGESEDIWYRASTPADVTDEFGRSLNLYVPDEPAWPMGCVTQHQFCKGGRCTGLGSHMDTVTRLTADLDVNSSFFGPSSYVSMVETVEGIVSALGTGALAGSQKGPALQQVGPRHLDEWHRDVTHWFSTILAFMQLKLVDIATGPQVDDIPGLHDFVKTPPANETQQFCHSQKIRSTAYTSFSMFWLLFVLVIGLLIVLVSTTLESIATLVQRWLRRSDGYASLEWRANHALHLQRLAHEQHSDYQRGDHHPSGGEQAWIQGSWDIPVASTDLKLPTLKEDCGLPRLMTSFEVPPLVDDGEEVRGQAIPDGDVQSDEAGAVKIKAEPEVAVEERPVSVVDDYIPLSASAATDASELHLQISTSTPPLTTD